VLFVFSLPFVILKGLGVDGLADFLDSNLLGTVLVF